MLVLALDTATPACSVAVVEITWGRPHANAAAGGPTPPVPPTGPAPLAAPATPVAAAVTRAARSTVDARRHGELLAPSLRAVLDEAEVGAAELAAVVAGIGPGPYTSLRVGVVTAAAFADAAALPAFGVCSLDGIGLAGVTSPTGAVGLAGHAGTGGGRGQAGAGPVAAVTDARRREVFWAVYAGGTRTAGPAVGRPGDVAGALRAAGVRRAVGPGAALYAGVFGELAEPAAPPAYPDPAVLASLAAPAIATGTPPPPLVPLYLRRPDAAAPHPPKTVTA